MFQAAGNFLLLPAVSRGLNLDRYTIERPMKLPVFAMLVRALAAHAWLELIPTCNPVLKHLNSTLN